MLSMVEPKTLRTVLPELSQVQGMAGLAGCEKSERRVLNSSGVTSPMNKAGSHAIAVCWKQIVTSGAESFVYHYNELS